MTDLWTGLAMVLVVEGLCYALFPNEMIKFMRQMLEMPPQAMRWVGVMAMAIGVFLVWVICYGSAPIAG